MNPLYHARVHAKKFGGVAEDYLPLNNFMDSSGYAHSDIRHRAVLHSAYGVYLCEQVFGQSITLSTGKKVPVKDIAISPIEQDLGFVPTLSDYLNNMTIQGWMSGTERKNKGKKSKFIPFDKE